MSTTFPSRISFKRTVVKFALSKLVDFDARRDSLLIKFENELEAHHRAGKKPRFNVAPGIRGELMSDKTTTDIEFINEPGFGAQLTNGSVMGQMTSTEAFPLFSFCFDTLLHTYRQVFPEATPRDFTVQSRTILAIKNIKNYGVLGQVIPSVGRCEGIFSPIADFAKSLKCEPRILRLDMDVTEKVGPLEFVLGLEAPANEDSSLLWVTVTVRSPQEQYADERFFTLQSLQPSLACIHSVVSSLLEGHDVESASE